MSLLRAALAGILVLAAALPADAADAPSFRFERPVVPSGRGPQALAVDVPLLTGAASPRLDDLRLYDASGREVPWLLVAPPDPEPAWLRAPRILPLAPTRSESGFEADLGKPVLVDRLRISGLGAPLLKRYRLEGSGDRARWTLLVAEGTLFDLPEEKLTLLTASFPPSEVRYLRVTWDDRRSARPRAPALAEARSAATLAPPPPAKVAVPFERRGAEPGVSRFHVRLPGPNLPLEALELDVAGSGPLLRDARVLTYRLSDGSLAPVALGEATLRRTGRDGEVAADLRIPIRRPEGTDLELVVDDGSNPPLALSGIRLDLGPLPWIYFASDGGALGARFGAPALPAPRYDLAAMKESVSRARVAEARWGERRQLAAAPAAAGPLPPAGAPVDAALFAFRRRIPEGAAGLVSLSLDAAVLAHSEDLSDLRVVDGSGRQIPYLLEKRDEPLELALPAPKAEAPAKDEPRVSRYALALPFEGLPPARLVLSTSAAVFDRPVRLLGVRPPRDPRETSPEETLVAARWGHADPETPAPPLVLSFSPAGLSRLLLAVDEGDNAPLPLGAPKLLLPSFRLRFFAPAGEPLTLCYGAKGLGAPRYDIALLAPRLVGASASEVSLGPEPAPAPGAARSPAERRLFWVVLVAAVLVLLAVTARLMARPGSADAAQG